MDQRSQRDYIRWRGPELARSGYFRNWFEVACALRYEGAYCAHNEMNPFRREMLDRLCDQALNDLNKADKDVSFTVIFFKDREMLGNPVPEQRDFTSAKNYAEGALPLVGADNFAIYDDNGNVVFKREPRHA